jgi:superfamily I DNA and RNA helicase
MGVTVIRGSTIKPIASEALASLLGSAAGLDGFLYIGYPIIGSSEGRLSVDALLISQAHGVIIFDLVEGTGLGEHERRQDEVANKLEARLRTHSALVNRRMLAISLNTLSFGPAIPVNKIQLHGPYRCANHDSVLQAIGTIPALDTNATIYPYVLSALQNISSIRQARTTRYIHQPESRGAKLKHLEDSIATLDQLQSRAVIETVEGVQRIRGLAGSGKTIVLALKAAYLHAQHPDWRIGVTFNTRSLKGQFRRLINTFCVAQTGEEPDWDQIRVLNAWGAPGDPSRHGLYYEYCKLLGAPYYDYQTAKDKFGRNNAFAGACGEALQYSQQYLPAYDALLVDEAQDFAPTFLRLCYQLLREPRQLVYAYDELQNLAGESVPPPEAIFGNKPDGTPLVTLAEPTPTGARRDIILRVCYRNSRPVLTSAHALGFGVYRECPDGASTGLIQMFDDPSLWEDIGYRVKEGALLPGSDVTLERTPESSPPFLENHSPEADLIQFLQFDSLDSQNNWIAEQISENVNNEELRHDDIVVINPNPLKTREAVGPIRSLLHDYGISSHLAGVTTDPDVFFTPGTASITFTGVFRAKGNEAGMVYVINAHDCHSSWNLASIRNQLFTAITRSKAWVRVCGVGPSMDALVTEFRTIQAHHFELAFRYPTEEERHELSIVHRDVDQSTRKKIEEGQKSLVELLAEIERGDAHLQDLSPSVVAKLREILNRADQT